MKPDIYIRKPPGYGKTVRPVVWDVLFDDPDTAHQVREIGNARSLTFRGPTAGSVTRTKL